MKFKIDFNLPPKEFREYIEHLIDNSKKSKSTLVLPCHVSNVGFELMALILGQINCENCDGRCCQSVEFAKFGIPFLDSEYKTLEEYVGTEKLSKYKTRIIGRTRYFPTPCPFLHKKTCTIYEIRPVVCVDFPFEKTGVDAQGNPMVALDSFCPEARRIARRTYLSFRKLIDVQKVAIDNAKELDEGMKQEQILDTQEKRNTASDE